MAIACALLLQILLIVSSPRNPGLRAACDKEIKSRFQPNVPGDHRYLHSLYYPLSVWHQKRLPWKIIMTNIMKARGDSHPDEACDTRRHTHWIIHPAEGFSSFHPKSSKVGRRFSFLKMKTFNTRKFREALYEWYKVDYRGWWRSRSRNYQFLGGQWKILHINSVKSEISCVWM